MAGAAAVAVTHSRGNCGLAGQADDLGAIAMSCWAVTVKPFPEAPPAAEGEAEGAADIRAGRRAPSVVRRAIVDRILPGGCYYCYWC